MPKEAFGGDDSSRSAPEKKKIGLSRFGLSPDANIRDVFWRIMGAYAATKKPGLELSTLANDRFALMRIAITVLSSQHGERYGLSPKFIASYSLMMIIDGEWNDAFSEYLEKACEKKLGIKKDVTSALKKLLAQEKYSKAIGESLGTMVRGRDSGAVALEYIADLESNELVLALKKELMIIARGDIGQNQLNAIKAIALIREDEEIRKSLIILLSHWDAQARFAAAEALLGMQDNPDVKAAVAQRLESERDEEIIKLLKRMAS
ncbi:MAG: hypothetical protein V1861_05265 [Candidatus Micrarchaeota archaeon]